jgi:bifunctional diaminopimelate decarboxylase / aspartate kinase
MNALMRPCLYDAYHEIKNLTKIDEYDQELMECDIVGNICESGDILGRNRKLPKSTTENDILVVECAGAYCETMILHDYNMRLKPKVIVFE